MQAPCMQQRAAAALPNCSRPTASKSRLPGPRRRSRMLVVSAEAQQASAGNTAPCSCNGGSLPPAAGAAGAGATSSSSSNNGSGAPDVQRAQVSECEAPCVRPAQQSSPPPMASWPPKAELFIIRSDGERCSRETVTADSGSLQFECPSSQQQLLVWKQRPKRALVLKKLGPELLPQLIEVSRCLQELGLAVVIEPSDHAALAAAGLGALADTFQDEELPQLHSVIDFVVCLGGDGLLLHAAALFGSALPPVISFKLGSLGFLAAHSYADHRQHLQYVVHGCRQLESCQVLGSADESGLERPLQGVYVTLRMRLECEVWRAGEDAASERHEVLNEVVLSRGSNPYLSMIEVYERGRLITRVQADGVMLATPTGSTAYNVAAGGSMVHPSVPAILFTPICPHSLNFRPIVLPDYVELELRIAPGSRGAAVACFDGGAATELRQGDSVRVRMSPNPVPTINNEELTTDWISAVQRCFQWSERVEQRAMEPSAAAAVVSSASNGTAAPSANGTAASSV